MATPQDLLLALARAYSLTDTHSTGDPDLEEALESVRRAQGEVGWVIVKMDEYGLRVGDQTVEGLPEDTTRFGEDLGAAGITELRLQEVMEARALEAFLRRVHPSSRVEGVRPSARFRGFQGALGFSFRETGAGLPGMAGGIQGLFSTPEPPSPEPPAQEPDFSAEKPVQAVDESPSALEEPAFEVEETAPAFQEPTFEVEDLAPAVEEPTFEVEDLAPAHNEPTFDVEDLAPGIEGPEFSVEEPLEGVSEPVFTMEDFPPSRAEVSPETDEPVSTPEADLIPEPDLDVALSSDPDLSTGPGFGETLYRELDSLDEISVSEPLIEGEGAVGERASFAFDDFPEPVGADGDMGGIPREEFEEPASPDRSRASFAFVESDEPEDADEDRAGIAVGDSEVPEDADRDFGGIAVGDSEVPEDADRDFEGIAVGDSVLPEDADEDLAGIAVGDSEVPVGTEPHINPFETIQLGQNLVDPAPSVPDDEPTKETAGPGAATDSATPPPAPGAAAAEPVETAPDPVETAPDPVEAAPDPVEPTPEPVEPATEPAAQAPFPGEVPEPSLADLVGAYLGADGGKQREAEKALRAGARAAADRREFGVLADLVELMADSAEGGDEDRDLRALIEEFTSPAVASVIVARLASSEEEGERARLGRVLSQVGPEGALALTDALEQARDRFERKNLLGAMVGLGPWGFEMAKRMVDDPRWYVVRNGVAVLGEIGGMDAVSHLTSTLASRDRRVRRETVRALAKIGGADAESLLLGMLSDGETEVRSGACRALGLLGSIRAVRRLQDLMDDPEQDVQVECIQALGHIGDPGPVQSIEKKAFGGFFSRPPREVRIAAFRALAAIGTPRAVKALERGAKDSDGKVRASVRTLLGVA